MQSRWRNLMNHPPLPRYSDVNIQKVAVDNITAFTAIVLRGCFPARVWAPLLYGTYLTYFNSVFSHSFIHSFRLSSNNDSGCCIPSFNGFTYTVVGMGATLSIFILRECSERGNAAMLPTFSSLLHPGISTEKQVEMRCSEPVPCIRQVSIEFIDALVES